MSKPKVTYEIALAALQRVAAGDTEAQASRELGISTGSVNLISHGKYPFSPSLAAPAAWERTTAPLRETIATIKASKRAELEAKWDAITAEVLKKARPDGQGGAA